MSNQSLPEGWESGLLVDSVSVQSGVGFPKKYQGQPSGDYPVYKVGDVSRAVLNKRGLLDVAGHYVSEEVANELKGKVFVIGTTVFAKIGEAVRLNRRAFVQRPGLVDNNVMGVKAWLSEMDTFIHYYLKTVDLNEASRSTTVPSIRKGDIENLAFQYPPLAEQKEIALRLDDLLAQVDSIKTRLDGLPAILKRFRQSTLAAATSGKLTEEWRGNELYSSVNLNLSKRSLAIDFPQSWEVEKLQDSCGVISGNAFKSGDFVESGVPVIKISNVQYGEFEVKNQQYLPHRFLENYPRFIINPSDVLMALTRPITNDTLKICRYPENAELGLLNQRVCKFDFANDDEKSFFELLFQSDYFKAQVADNLSETLQPNLSPKDLKKFIVGVPSAEEQTEIVRRVEELFAFADQVEQRVNDAQARVNHLTQSILAKAFRGELTEEWRSKNSDLITGENSASALLERIKSERQVKQVVKKGGKRKAKAPVATSEKIVKAPKKSSSRKKTKSQTAKGRKAKIDLNNLPMPRSGSKLDDMGLFMNRIQSAVGVNKSFSTVELSKLVSQESDIDMKACLWRLIEKPYKFSVSNKLKLEISFDKSLGEYSFKLIGVGTK